MIKEARKAIAKLDWWVQLIVCWFAVGMLLLHAWIILANGLTFNGIFWTGMLMVIEAAIAFVAFMVDWEVS